MVTVHTLLQGFSVNTSEGALSYCAVTLLRGEHTTLVDVGHQGRRALLIERLAAVGLTPADIDRVVLTHAHWDHAFNLLSFPNAEVVLHASEEEYTHHPHPDDWATPAFTSDILRRCKTVSTVQEGDELERGVRVLATPGHSPGSMTLLVDTPEGITGLVGDALPSRAAARILAPRLIFWDEAEARRSARRIVESCRLIVPGHDRAFTVHNGEFHYAAETMMTLLNPPRDADGTIRASIDPAEQDPGPVIAPFARRMTPA